MRAKSWPHRGSTLALLWLMGVACANEPSGPRATAPTWNGVPDERFAIDWVREWYLIGNAVTPGHNMLQVQVTAPADTEFVDAWIDGAQATRLWTQDGAWVAELPVGELGPGAHQLLLASDNATTAFAEHTFVRSHPLYVIMSTDWDFAEPGQDALEAHGRLRAKHPELKYTHFVGPYSFTDPALTEARKAELATWLRTQSDDHGDEIGLHIHPYCHFVEAAGVACNTSDSVVYAQDATGYSINLSAYDEVATSQMLAKADELFMARDLGKPTTFRAGAWTASLPTLRALAGAAYVADTSACNWMRLEEWQGLGNGELYRWNSEHWASVSDVSQPYYPSVDDAQRGGTPALSLLEVPDNGIMLEYVTVDEVRTMLEANWAAARVPSTDALARPVTFMTGFHPSPRFDLEGHLDRVTTVFDDYLASRDAGPIVFAILRDMPAVFTP